MAVPILTYLTSETEVIKWERDKDEGICNDFGFKLQSTVSCQGQSRAASCSPVCNDRVRDMLVGQGCLGTESKVNPTLGGRTRESVSSLDHELRAESQVIAFWRREAMNLMIGHWHDYHACATMLALKCGQIPHSPLIIVAILWLPDIKHLDFHGESAVVVTWIWPGYSWFSRRICRFSHLIGPRILATGLNAEHNFDRLHGCTSMTVVVSWYCRSAEPLEL